MDLYAAQSNFYCPKARTKIRQDSRPGSEFEKPGRCRKSSNDGAVIRVVRDVDGVETQLQLGDRSELEAHYIALGKDADTLFPLKFETEIETVIKGEVPAFLYMDGDRIKKIR